MTARHTPGPWQYHVTVDGDAIVASGGKMRVAEALVRDVGYEDERANARLIAAAPDLLSVVEGLKAWWLSDGISGNAALDELVHQARIAIAKATGSKP